MVGGEGAQHLWIDRDQVRADVTLFQEALEADDRERALALYGGDFLAGVRVQGGERFHRWADERRSHYRRRAFGAALALGERRREAGELEEAEEIYRRALDLAPLKEEAAGGLIRVLAAQNKRADALKLYEAFCDRLERELELSPSAELEELAGRVRSTAPEALSVASASGDPGSTGVPGREGGSGSQFSSPWVLAGSALIVLALVGVALWFTRPGPGEGPSGPAPAEGRGKPSVAVLPFENLSGTREADPFLRGLHSELLTRLSTVDSVDLVSRSSVRSYRGGDSELEALADSLEVEWILEGGVQKVGDRVKVNAQLVDAQTGASAWAASYERRVSARNLFEIQEELTREIVRALDVELTPEDERRVESVPTENTAAYELYLQAEAVDEQQWSTEKSVARKTRLFRRALEMDSTFAEAWAGLADALVDRAWKRGWDRATADSARRAAERALELEPELARAHVQLGDAHWVLDNEERLLESYARALELDPGDPATTNNLLVFLARNGRYAEKLKWLDRLGRPLESAGHVRTLVATNVLLGRDSVAQEWRTYARRRGFTLTETNFAVALIYRDDVERARALLGELADGEESAHDLRRRGLVALYAGEWTEARGLYRRLYSVSTGGPAYIGGLFDDRIGLAWSLQRLGLEAEAREIADRVSRDAERAIGSGVPGPAVRNRAAVANLLLGDTADALDWLEDAVEVGERRLPRLRTAPTLDPLRGHPRFQRLLDRVGAAVARQRRRADEEGWGEPEVDEPG